MRTVPDGSEHRPLGHRDSERGDLAPAINGYVSDAQHASARKDVEAIGSALSRLLTDVGEAWILRDGNGAAAANAAVARSRQSG